MDHYPRYSIGPKGYHAQKVYDQHLDILDATKQYESMNLNTMMDVAKSSDCAQLKVWSAPGLDRPLFKDIVDKVFRPVQLNDQFGPSWSSHWFKVDVTIPQEWKSFSSFEFQFDCECEGAIYNLEGDVLQGLTGGDKDDHRYDFLIPNSWAKNGSFCFYVEVGLNDRGGNCVIGHGPPRERLFTLRMAQLVVPNWEARALAVDFKIIKDCSRLLPQESWESHLARNVASKIVATFKRGNQQSIEQCREIAKQFVGRLADSPDVYATKDERRTFVHAIGNCHIDTAWLWPFDETKRKVARSWATQLALMDQFPEYKFVASQAQQFAWMESDYPSLFDRIVKAAKDGKFLPIGGAWVEMDANMPSGEAIARQFLYGQRYFEEKFGTKSRVLWLPDTFGYCSQLPQICRLSGMDYGFTQKISWNTINDFPHTTFNWVALDGTQMLMHMAPSETYVGQCEVKELLKSISRHKSLDATQESLLLFGNGDGGGGPSPIMLEKLRRLRGVSDTIGSLPRVHNLDSVETFYDKVAQDTENGSRLATWVGELYLEMHRGTLTTEAKIKKSNRKLEILLHDVELLASLASIYCSGFSYPKQQLDELWHKTLLCQFHDVLPGTSIKMVVDDVHQMYEQIETVGNELLENSCRELGFPVCKKQEEEGKVLNLLPWDASEILLQDNNSVAKKLNDDIVLENSRFRVVINNDGGISSIIDKSVGCELVSSSVRFVMFDDKAIYWQAWDTEIYSLDTRSEVMASSVEIIGSSVICKYAMSAYSKLIVSISLKNGIIDFNCTVDWYEKDIKCLRVEFPLNIVSNNASYESQFGITERPTHFNTSWDQARFEVCCHKWADLSESSYGVAVLNDSKYGCSTHGSKMSLSLLRSSKEPNPDSDIGVHQFGFALMPHKGGLSSDIVRTAREYNCNSKVFVKGENLKVLSSIQVEGDSSVILDSVKRGEDDEEFGSYKKGLFKKSVVLRLYESLGGRSRVTVKTAFVVSDAYVANILEERVHDLQVRDNQIELVFRPFEIMTVVLCVE